MKIPVLYLIFNRPEKVLESFMPIRNYKPDRLYIVADGPRREKLGEKEKCDFTRSTVIDLIDWDCEVKKLFREENLGCGRSIFDGISWFFGQEEYGIIIEDDCVVAEDFFAFCEELLPKYAKNDLIAEISAFNIKGAGLESNTYRFTNNPKIWGWATWQRSWKNIDFEMLNWKKSRWALFKRFSFTEAFIRLLIWERFYRKIRAGAKPHTWDYQWNIYVYMNRMLCVQSDVNLVSNIGSGPDSSHNTYADSPELFIKHGRIIFPLLHPSSFSIDPVEDSNRSHQFLINFFKLFISKIKYLLK